MRNPNHRTRLGHLALLAALTISLAGCGDGGDQRAGASGDDECGLVQLESLDSAVDIAGELGGETVADTEIHFTDGDAMASLGGLEVPMPMLHDLDYWNPEVRIITIPPSWPTLDRMQLDSHASSDNPSIGLAVLAQTTSVTVAACRRELFDGYWAVARFTEAEETHASEITNAETGVTCWTETRYGRTRPGFDDSHRSVVLFAGNGIASSAIIFWGPSAYTEIPQNTGDLVEAVCGTRPDGL